MFRPGRRGTYRCGPPSGVPGDMAEGPKTGPGPEQGERRTSMDRANAPMHIDDVRIFHFLVVVSHELASLLRGLTD